MKEASGRGKKKLKADVLLVLGLLLFSLTLFIVFNGTKKDGTAVRVTLNGEKLAEYSLSINAEYKLNGGSNILKIENGRAFIIYANCPDKICVHAGEIRLTGERIVCLPNKLMVEIIGEADSDIDFVS